jgi:hypothetical protein
MKTSHVVRALLIAAAIVALVATHGAILYFFSTHVTVSVAVVSGAALVLILKHVGVLGPLYARLRRRSPR